MSPAAPRALPWALVLVLAAALAWSAWRSATQSRRAPYAPPVVSDPDEAIEGLGAEVEIAPGAKLVYRLTPLYADPARQAFEALSLRRRLALPEGQPWRLVRTLEGTLDAGARSPVFTDAPEIVVSDEGGPALTALAPPGHGDGVVDPVRSLVATFAVDFAGAGRRTWILWGRAPRGAARAVFSAGAGGASSSVALAPRTVKRSEIEVPLAQLDRAVGGKNGGVPASENGRGTPVERQR